MVLAYNPLPAPTATLPPEWPTYGLAGTHGGKPETGGAPTRAGITNCLCDAMAAGGLRRGPQVAYTVMARGRPGSPRGHSKFIPPPIVFCDAFHGGQKGAIQVGHGPLAIRAAAGASHGMQICVLESGFEI